MMTDTRVSVEILKPHLSPSALADYEICGRRGQFHQDPTIPRFTTQGLLFGKAWHHMMETYGRARLYYSDLTVGSLDPAKVLERLTHIGLGYMAEGARRDDYVTLEDDEPWEDLELALRRMINVWLSSPSYRWMGENVNITTVETQVRVEFGSDTHQFLGYLDAVYDVPGYGAVGVDYKTASRAWSGSKLEGDPRVLPQAPLYAEAWMRDTGEQMNSVAFDVMTKGGKFQRVFVDTRPEVRQPFIERWKGVAESIELHRAANKPMPVNPSHYLCSAKWCGYWDLCDMGAPLETKLSPPQPVGQPEGAGV